MVEGVPGNSFMLSTLAVVSLPLGFVTRMTPSVNPVGREFIII